jgi:hypothetical protein
VDAREALTTTDLEPPGTPKASRACSEGGGERPYFLIPNREDEDRSNRRVAHEKDSLLSWSRLETNS